MEVNTCVIEHLPVEFSPVYICGAWDGAFAPDACDVEVGLGWTIEVADSLNSNGVPRWRPLLRAYGKAHGRSAIWAELLAMESLSLCVNAALHGRTIDWTFLPAFNESPPPPAAVRVPLVKRSDTMPEIADTVLDDDDTDIGSGSDSDDSDSSSTSTSSTSSAQGEGTSDTNGLSDHSAS